MIKMDLMRVECKACGTSIAIELTWESFTLHCPLCGQEIEVNQPVTGGENGFCRFCHRTLDDHTWNMTQGSYEHTCRERR